MTLVFFAVLLKKLLLLSNTRKAKKSIRTILAFVSIIFITPFGNITDICKQQNIKFKNLWGNLRKPLAKRKRKRKD